MKRECIANDCNNEDQEICFSCYEEKVNELAYMKMKEKKVKLLLIQIIKALDLKV